jgi:hypothetical protein
MLHPILHSLQKREIYLFQKNYSVEFIYGSAYHLIHV